MHPTCWSSPLTEQFPNLPPPFFFFIFSAAGVKQQPSQGQEDLRPFFALQPPILPPIPPWNGRMVGRACAVAQMIGPTAPFIFATSRRNADGDSGKKGRGEERQALSISHSSPHNAREVQTAKRSREFILHTHSIQLFVFLCVTGEGSHARSHIATPECARAVIVCRRRWELERRRPL